jgi:hypothetical protein
MSNYRVDIEGKVIISFDDPVKAKRYFLESDWKDYFYTFHDLSEVAQHIAGHFIEPRTRIFIEGFGEAYRPRYKSGFNYVIENDDSGNINIFLDEPVEVTDVLDISGSCWNE